MITGIISIAVGGFLCLMGWDWWKKKEEVKKLKTRLQTVLNPPKDSGGE